MAKSFCSFTLYENDGGTSDGKRPANACAVEMAAAAWLNEDKCERTATANNMLN